MYFFSGPLFIEVLWLILAATLFRVILLVGDPLLVVVNGQVPQPTLKIQVVEDMSQPQPFLLSALNKEGVKVALFSCPYG